MFLPTMYLFKHIIPTYPNTENHRALADQEILRDSCDVFVIGSDSKKKKKKNEGS